MIVRTVLTNRLKDHAARAAASLGGTIGVLVCGSFVASVVILGFGRAAESRLAQAQGEHVAAPVKRTEHHRPARKPVRCVPTFEDLDDEVAVFSI